MAISRPQVNADDYDEDIRPTRTRSQVFEREDEDEAPKIGTTVQSGWDMATEALKSEKSDEYVKDFKFEEEPTLVKFLGDGPFKVYRQHWIERQGKKSFVCLEDECPLCDLLGDEPRNKFAFTVVSISENGPEVFMLSAPPTLFRQLKAAHEDARKGPLNKHYWALSRTGTGPKTTYIIDMVRARDLAEEWDLDPLSVEEALDTVEPLTAEVIYVTPRADLIEIAKASA